MASRAVNLAELVSAENLTVTTSTNRIGVGSTAPTAKFDVAGIVSATSFFGDAAGLTNLPAGGATLSAASGSQRVVVTSLTSGTMTAAGTNADLAYNTSTNTLSATTFSGALTGNVTGNASGTAGGLSGNPSISITNLTGVAATFTGNVTIGGTLTYDDVTNVDSIGIVTARTGIKVTAGGINVVGGGLTVTGISTFSDVVTFTDGLRVPGGTGGSNRIELGNSQELTFQYNTSSTKGIITAAANPIDIQATTIKLLPNTGENGVIVNQNGAVDLYHDNALKLSTASIGATVTGSLLVGAGQSFGSIDGATAVYYGDGSNLTGIAAGISSSQSAPSANTVVTLNLGTAQHHELNLAAGITTITCTGGNPGESHSIVLTQPSSGITTVGFSTYFLFPSGSIPSMSEGSSKVDLVSFVIKRVGTVVGVAATELLASAGLNYSN